VLCNTETVIIAHNTVYLFVCYYVVIDRVLCYCAALVAYSINIMVHKGTCSSYRLVDCIGL